MKFLNTFIFLAASIFVNGQGQNAKDTSFNWETIDRYSYSVQYPGSWTIDTSKRLGADVFIFSQKDADTDKFRENVNVMIQDLKGLNITLDKYVDISEEQIRTILTNASIIESKRMNPGSKEYHKLIFTGQQGVYNIETQQFYFLVNEKAFVITLTTEQNQYDKYKESGEAILRSFKLKE